MSYFSIQKTLTILLFAFLTMSGMSADAASRETLEERKEAKTVNNPIVVELFTASDCLACAAADRMLYEAMKDKQVIALSCHIKDMKSFRGDDNAGNQDVNGGDGSSEGPIDPCFFRQWSYMTSGRSQDITLRVPMFVFNGSDKINVANLNLYDQTFGSYHGRKNKTIESPMSWKDSDTVSIYLPQHNFKQRDKITAGVWLVRYQDILIEKVTAGDNKDRVMRFSNVVQSIKHVGKWYGVPRQIDIDVPKPVGGKESGGYAVLVGEFMGSSLLSAGKLKDYVPSSPPVVEPAPVPKPE